MADEITNTQDYIDSRDVIERVAELEALEPDEIDEDETEELTKLRAFIEEAETAEDWQCGAQFIHEDSFEEHARTLAEDIGAIEHADRWPNYCIDWEWAARELKSDYSSFNFDGATYYAR